MRLAYQQDPVAQAVDLLIDQTPDGIWRGNTRALLTALAKAANKAQRSDLRESKRWPKIDTWLGRDIRRSAAALKKVAWIEIKFNVDQSRYHASWRRQGDLPRIDQQRNDDRLRRERSQYRAFHEPLINGAGDDVASGDNRNYRNCLFCNRLSRI